jgi:hypothetical protein
MIVAVVLIVAAVVVYLVSTIFALRKITAGLDVAINGVGGILEKSAPVADVVGTINQQLDAGVDLLEGLLVKKAGLDDAVGLVEGLYPGAAANGLRNFPESREVKCTPRARSLWPGWAVRRPSPPLPPTGRRSATRPQAAWRPGLCIRISARPIPS